MKRGNSPRKTIRRKAAAMTIGRERFAKISAVEGIRLTGEMKRLFAGLKKRNFLRGLDAVTFAKEAAHFLAELNAVPPFREGNGRTQLSFLTILAERAKHPLNMDRLSPPAIMKATVRSFA